jgi:hypothetical protein
MSFKENLLKKIQIDKMAENLLGSIGPLAPPAGLTRESCADFWKPARIRSEKSGI